MRKTVWFSQHQEERRQALGVGMPEVIEAGLRALESRATLPEPPLQLRTLSPDLLSSVAQVQALLDAVARGRLAVVQEPGKKQAGLGVVTAVCAAGVKEEFSHSLTSAPSRAEYLHGPGHAVP